MNQIVCIKCGYYFDNDLKKCPQCGNVMIANYEKDILSYKKNTTMVEDKKEIIDLLEEELNDSKINVLMHEANKVEDQNLIKHSNEIIEKENIEKIDNKLKSSNSIFQFTKFEDYCKKKEIITKFFLINNICEMLKENNKICSTKDMPTDIEKIYKINNDMNKIINVIIDTDSEKNLCNIYSDDLNIQVSTGGCRKKNVNIINAYRKFVKTIFEINATKENIIRNGYLELIFSEAENNSSTNIDDLIYFLNSQFKDFIIEYLCDDGTYTICCPIINSYMKYGQSKIQEAKKSMIEKIKIKLKIN